MGSLGGETKKPMQEAEKVRLEGKEAGKDALSSKLRCGVTGAQSARKTLGKPW